MRLINGFNPAFYLNSIDEKGHKHHYRLTPSQLAEGDWIDEVVTDYYPSTFKLSQIISDESARNLWKAVHFISDESARRLWTAVH